MKSVRAIRALDIPSPTSSSTSSSRAVSSPETRPRPPARSAEVAQQGGGGVHRPGRAELAERGERGPCFVDGDLRRLGGGRARELQSRLSDVERHRERAERGQRAVGELGGFATVVGGIATRAAARSARAPISRMPDASA